MTAGIPKHLECLRGAGDRGCHLGGGGSCGTPWGTGAPDEAHTPMNKQTVIPRPPGSTGPFLKISALNCKISLFQVFCKAPKSTSSMDAARRPLGAGQMSHMCWLGLAQAA